MKWAYSSSAFSLAQKLQKREILFLYDLITRVYYFIVVSGIALALCGVTAPRGVHKFYIRSVHTREMTFVQVNAIHSGDVRRVAHTCQRGSTTVDGEYKSQTSDIGSISLVQKDFCIPVVGPICGNANKTSAPFSSIHSGRLWYLLLKMGRRKITMRSLLRSHCVARVFRFL